ncbi:MAG: hypothetical protein M3Y38_00630, partial [Actinomycetota bacterium]|nr:hypothetical protein [Actinomycetota bacterium]
MAIVSPEDRSSVSERVSFLAHAVDEAWPLSLPFDPPGIHATAGDRRTGAGAAEPGGVDAGNGAVRTLCPQAAR